MGFYLGPAARYILGRGSDTVRRDTDEADALDFEESVDARLDRRSELTRERGSAPGVLDASGRLQERTFGLLVVAGDSMRLMIRAALKPLV